MEGQSRGRSPSAGHGSNQHIRSSPSPHNFTGHVSQAEFGNPSPNQAFSTNFNSDVSPTTVGNLGFNPYLDAGGQQQYTQASNAITSSDFNGQKYDPSFQPNGINANSQQIPSPLSPQSDAQLQSDMLSLETGFPGFPQTQDFNPKQDLLLDPQLAARFSDQSINPQDIMSNMSSPQNLIPTPPYNHMRPQHSEPTSPFTPGPQVRQQSPGHSRNPSLDPATAYTNGQPQDWSMMGPQFQGHRRTPSEYSDVSSSNAQSPYLQQGDGFDLDQSHHSPLLQAQQDPQIYADGLGMESVNLSDQQQQRASPRHSPYVSPRIAPQQGMGSIPDAPFGRLPENQNFNGAFMQEGFATEAFPTVKPEQRLGSNDFGRADQYEVPQINVESAPISLPGALENARSPTDVDALSPPDRGKFHDILLKTHAHWSSGRRRGRAKSDTHIPRSPTPSSTHATLGSPDSSFQRQASLSPFDTGYSPHSSRPTSPAPRSQSTRRSSTSSIPNRDYILELADPNRPPAPGTEKRVQKHPATFSCHLCPKKFTRAYNLRSHLRTHTDERPFVCTVCSKAFARQHDRKRHEGLHSGEKKFVCRGELGTGAQWGCGRRFARADALGRHFRSEAGRVCIKPLLDEEALERQKLDDQMRAQHMAGGIAPHPPMNGLQMQQQFAFPQALLQQFPQLQGLQWDQLQGGPDEDDFSGRSSFDASSGGGDYYDDEDARSGYMSDNPMGMGFQHGVGWQHDQGWKSDVEP